MADPERKMSDVSLLYCEDPVNDPGGGIKERSRTLEKSYRPDLPQLANAWHCVSNADGKGTYKVQQKDLPNISPYCWMLVGENEGADNKWHSAKMRVGDFLELNGAPGWPAFGPTQFVDMAPHQPGNLNHITQDGSENNGSGAAWAYPNSTLLFKAQLAGDPFGETYKASDLTYTWRISRGPLFVADLNVQAATINFTGGAGETAMLNIKITHAPTGKEVNGDLTIMGQNPDSLKTEDS